MAPKVSGAGSVASPKAVISDIDAQRATIGTLSADTATQTVVVKAADAEASAARAALQDTISPIVALRMAGKPVSPKLDDGYKAALAKLAAATQKLTPELNKLGLLQIKLTAAQDNVLKLEKSLFSSQAAKAANETSKEKEPPAEALKVAPGAPNTDPGGVPLPPHKYP